MTHPEVTLATPADRERVIDTVVAAFAADPAFRYFFPDEGSYDVQARAFVGHLFDKRVGLGTVWTIGGGASVAMWDPPATDVDVVVGEPATLDLPAETMDRLEAYDAIVHAALPRAPHWYLGILATHPDYAGRRWGRAVMAAGLGRATTAGLPAYLETTNPSNVQVYRRAGWEVTRTLTAESVAVWIMAYASGPVTPGWTGA